MPKKTKLNELILGIDYGERNIGLSFGRNELVSPLKVISGKNDDSAITEIVRYAMENKIDRIVIGLPLNVEGKDTAQSRKVRRFTKFLKIRFKKPIDFVNEFRSTKNSKTETIRLGVSKKRRKKIDHYSAALILKEYYARLPHS